jgi:hypothetical protein
MAHVSFETPFTEAQFHITNLEAPVHEGPASPAPPLPAPIGIIRTDQQAHVHLHWDTEGSLVPLLQGFWHVDLYLERMGPGADLKAPVGPPEGIDVALTPGPSPRHYDVLIDISPSTLPLPPVDHPQNYMLVTTITYKFCKDGGFGLMAGFVEGPMVQIYRPV